MHQNTVQKVAVMLLIIGLIIPCHLLGLSNLSTTLLAIDIIDIIAQDFLKVANSLFFSHELLTNKRDFL